MEELDKCLSKVKEKGKTTIISNCFKWQVCVYLGVGDRLGVSPPEYWIEKMSGLMEMMVQLATTFLPSESKNL